MGLFLSNMIIYIYNSLYAQTGLYNTLTMYSGAIMGTLQDGGTLHTVYLTIRSVGYGVLVMYFVIAMGTKLSSRATSPNVIVQTLIQFLVGVAFTTMSFQIVIWLFTLGDNMAGLILESTTPSNIDIDDFVTILGNTLENNISFAGQAMYVLKAFLPWVGCVITEFVVTYAIITRVIRICVNAVLSPIAIANFFDGSRHSDGVKFLDKNPDSKFAKLSEKYCGVKFLKKTFAMCLQCSAIMIITAAVANISGYMAASDLYSTQIQGKNAIETATSDLIASREPDTKSIDRSITDNINVMGLGVRDPKYSKLFADKAQFKNTCGKVTKDKEEKFKKMESEFNIDIFKKNGSSYVYDENGYAMIKEKYQAFSSETMEKFLLAILGGNGGTGWIFLLLLVVKIGLIKQSNSLCNVIVGV